MTDISQMIFTIWKLSMFSIWVTLSPVRGYGTNILVTKNESAPFPVTKKLARLESHYANNSTHNDHKH